MSRQLTARSSLESLKKEAKRWLKALRADDAEARRRLEHAHPEAPPRQRKPLPAIWKMWRTC